MIEIDLKPTCDRKTRFYDSQQNTFGLMPGRPPDGSCPGCTIGAGGCCEIPEGRKTPICYVNRTLSYSVAARNVLIHNTELLKSHDEDGMTEVLAAEFRRFLVKELKRTDPADKASITYGEALARTAPYYRLHWSGDIFNVTYAKALAYAMLQFPEITFWNYTRSFFALKHLADVSNLMQYLSLDRVNVDKGLEAYRKWRDAFNGRLSVCYMGPEKDARLPESMVDCPADTGEHPVDGACASCRKCLRGCHIFFKQK